MKRIESFLSLKHGKLLIGLGLMLTMYIFDLYNIPTKLGITAISAWATFLGSIVAVLGTYFITKNSMQKQIDHQKEIWNKEKSHQKENMYRSMNKQNIEYFYKELRIFIDRLAYVGILKNIESGLLEAGLFQYEYEEADKYNNRFLTNVGKDYYYDKEIVELCEEGIHNPIVDKSEDEVRDLYHKFRRMFFGYASSDRETKLDDINRNAFMKLYQKLFSASSGREGIEFKMDVYLSDKYSSAPYYIPSARIEIYFNFINNVRDIIQNESGHVNFMRAILSLISSTKEEDIICELSNPVNLNQLTDEARQELMSLFKNNDDCSKIKKSIDEYFFENGEHRSEYGVDTDDEKEKYLKLIEDKFFSIKTFNYVVDFLEPNHYL